VAVGEAAPDAPSRQRFRPRRPVLPAALTGAKARVLLYRAGSRVVQLVPLPVVRAIAVAAGPVVAAAMPARRAMVTRHLRRVLALEEPLSPEQRRSLRRAVRRSFASAARYWLESLRLPALSTPEVDAGLTREGYHHVEEGLRRGKGVILALPHLGGWEWAGQWLGHHGLAPVVVVEPLEPLEVFAWFRSFRQSLGMDVVPLGPEAGTAVLRALRDNRIVCLLCDRDLQGGGVEVEFFGERTRLPAGPATLALRTGAALVPAAVYFRGGLHVGVVRPPLVLEERTRLRDDVAVLTQRLATELEELIRAAPEQWHLFQPNWPSDPGYRG